MHSRVAEGEDTGLEVEHLAADSFVHKQEPGAVDKRSVDFEEGKGCMGGFAEVEGGESHIDLGEDNLQDCQKCFPKNL